MIKEKKKPKSTSFISHDVHLKGDLYVKGGIRIDGTLKGKLESEATVFVGDTGSLMSDIKTDQLISSGSIYGSILATTGVSISKPGSVEGDITTSQFSVENGVYFNGKCKVLNPKLNKRPILQIPPQPNLPFSEKSREQLLIEKSKEE